MWPEDRDRIDLAIDAVAREMTEAADDAGFRVRVLARIPERRSTWRSPWVVSPVAVAALFVLAVALYHGVSLPRDVSAPAAQSGSGTSAAGRVSTGQATNVDRAAPKLPAEPVPPRSIAASAPDAPHRIAANRRGTLAEETSLSSTAAARSSGIDELAPPPIEIDTIALDRLARPEPLTLQPLDVPSIALAPIDDGDGQ